MYYTTSKDVCHKLYSNYYRSTINTLEKMSKKDIYRSFVRIIFIVLVLCFIDKQEIEQAIAYHNHILFMYVYSMRINSVNKKSVWGRNWMSHLEATNFLMKYDWPIQCMKRCWFFGRMFCNYIIDNNKMYTEKIIQ